MNKLIRRLAMAFVGISMAVGVGVAVGGHDEAREVDAAPTGAITNHTNIVAGDYYIGATTGGTDYYLSVNGSSTTTSIAGTAVTSKASGTIFTFAGSGTSWTIKFKNSDNYLGLNSTKDNGKLQVVDSPKTFTASTQSSKIRLTIGSYSIQKNNSGTQFGSYGNTQTDLWLLAASSKKATTTTVTAEDNKTSLDVTKSPADTVQLTASVSYNEGDVENPSITWESNQTSIATISSSGVVTAVARGVARLTASYAGDSTYEESSGYIDITVYNPNTFEFSEIDFSTWSSSYEEHIVEYEKGTVTFASADKNGQTITDIPVTKGGDVSFVVADGYYIAGVEFVCRQWLSKEQTITLHYSLDNGKTYTSTGVTSTNFTISKNDLAAKTNAVKITFNSSSNQVGIESLTITLTKTWAREFLDTFTCSGITQENPDGTITVANPSTVWSSFATSLDSDSALKATLKTLEADEDGTVNQQAMARYDLVIRKYGTGTYTDFIGRFSTGGANAAARVGENSLGLSQVDSATLIIIAISLVSLTAVGGYFVIRRRKENN